MGQLHSAPPGLYALESASAELPFDDEGESETEEAPGFANRLVSALKS